ncbi:MAG: glycosyltransferase family 2 protein [Alphaproteobacteria bacterium]
MKSPPVSLIIVSRKRPAHLLRVLQSLRHQTHDNFEVIVVADAEPSPFVNHVKYIPFPNANISAARNAGLAVATGEIVAFCDDDAIPDPPWLERLVSPFINKSTGAATGFTRGRNGISRQWGAMRFDLTGHDHPFEMDETQPFTVFAASPDMPVKLIGTNMAFRQAALLEINGFGENFRFYLDETDAKLRLDQAGWKTAVVPHAQVHHQYAASERRAQNRVPTDLFEIGASKAYFCNAHMKSDSSPALRDFTNEQLIRLTILVEQHKLRRRDVTPLMESLGNGMSEGLQRNRTTSSFTTLPSEFHRFETHNSEHIVVCAGPRDTKWMTQTARELVNAGKCVSVVQLLPSPRYFQVAFKDGYWLHRGGVFGKSTRTQPFVQITSYQHRFMSEIRRISSLYSVDRILTKSNHGIQL